MPIGPTCSRAVWPPCWTRVLTPWCALGASATRRLGWRNARWLDADGELAGPLAEFGRHAAEGLIDRPIWVARKRGPALALRLVAVRKSEPTAAAARRKARRQARKNRCQVSEATLAAADWVIPRAAACAAPAVTSLAPETFPTADVLALYRLRWRIELGFKRLKSLVGLNGPPGSNEGSAKPYVLAHLLAILLLEPIADELEVSPRWAAAA